MKASIEISLYPLSSDYKKHIISFVRQLKKQHDIEVVTNGMSTQLFGDYDILMDLLKNELKLALSNHRTMAILKIGEGLLRAEDIPKELQ